MAAGRRVGAPSGTYHYVLPGVGLYGGVKKAFHCAALLQDAGVRCEVATPGGARPAWFPNDAPTSVRETLAERCRPEDTVLFSFPPDADDVARLPARRKIVHMQGANTDADVALFAGPFVFISHGLHMTQQLLAHGLVAPYVPLGIPDVFRWRGEEKEARSVAVMSRKGGRLVQTVRRALPRGARLEVIAGRPEDEVAAILKRTDVFVAISAREAFGLPPLEAMAAGCAVVGYPGDGGFEFMRHGETAHVVPNGDARGLRRAVSAVLADPSYRDGLRQRAMETAAWYTLEREGAGLRRALGLEAGGAPAEAPG